MRPQAINKVVKVKWSGDNPLFFIDVSTDSASCTWQRISVGINTIVAIRYTKVDDDNFKFLQIKKKNENKNDGRINKIIFHHSWIFQIPLDYLRLFQQII